MTQGIQTVGLFALAPERLMQLHEISVKKEPLPQLGIEKYSQVNEASSSNKIDVLA